MPPPSDFHVACPGCGKSYHIPASLFGAAVTCETCGADFIVPHPAVPVPPAAAVPPAPNPATPRATTPAPPSASATTQASAPVPSPSSAPAPLSPRADHEPASGKPGGGLVKSTILVLTGACVVVGISQFLKKAPSAGPLPEPAPAPALPRATAESTANPPLPSTPGHSVTDTPPPAEQSPETSPAMPPPPEAEALANPAPGPAPAEAAASAPEIVPPPESPSVVPPSPAGPTPGMAAGPPVVPVPAVPAPAPAAPGLSKNDPLQIRRDSRAVLKQFLGAATVEERLAVSQRPDKIRAEIEAWHQAHPAGPLPVEDIRFLTEGEVENKSAKFHLYNVLLKDQEAPIPVALEQTPEGFRVDWQAFNESYSHRLKAFFATPNEKPGRFRVLLRRAHYFGAPVTGQDTVRIAYSIEPPMRDEAFTVWVEKDSILYREKLATGERAGWEAESYVIVELMWSGDEKRGRWVGLQRIVSDSWRAE